MKLIVTDYFYKNAKDVILNFVKNPDDIVVLNYEAFDLMHSIEEYRFIIDDDLPRYLETFKKYIIDKETL